MNFIFHPTIIIKQASLHSHQSLCPIQINSSPYLRTPLISRWKTSPSPNVPSSWNSPFNHSSLLKWSYNSRVLSWHPLWFPSLHWKIFPSLLTFLLTCSFMHVYDPRDHIIWEDIMVIGRGTHFVRVEARDHNHYWITCWVDYTGVEFMTQVDQCLGIDPNPQDVLSQLDWVGSLIWLWWWHLSELVWWSWRMQYWWLRREMRGRGEHREG